MAKETTNFKLKKPDKTDFVNVTEQLSDNLDIIDTELKEAQDKATQAFTQASNGKEAIKVAITGIDPTVTIPTDATFQQLADAIGQIETGVDTEDATATAEYILAGLTAYVKGAKVTGTGVNNGPVGVETVNLASQGAEYSIARGFHTGLRKIKATITGLISGNIKAGAIVGGIEGNFTSDATAGASATLNGYTGYQNGVKYTGNIPIVNPDYADQTLAINATAGAHSGDGQTYAYMNPNLNGKYSNGVNWVRSLQPGLIPANILAPATIFGVQGTAIAGKRYATGQVTSAENVSWYSPETGGPFLGRKVHVSQMNLSFVPSIVLLMATSNSWGAYSTIYFRQGFYSSSYGVYTCKSESNSGDARQPLRPASGDIDEIITTNFQYGSPFTFWAWE